MAFRLNSKKSPGAGEKTASRRYRPAGVKDARWVVGIVLLALGVLGTLRIVSAADDSVQIWSARSTLVPGQRVTSKDLVPTSVRLNDASARYLAADATPDGVVQRAISAGELVPRSALGAASSVDVRTVSVTLDRGQADVVRVGADVEVWVATKSKEAGATTFEKPTKIIDRALVSRIGGHSGGVVAVSDGQPVEIIVPREALAQIIDAVNSGARITLVPLVGGPRS